MNIALYTDSLTNEEPISKFVDAIEQGFLLGIIDDASVFYDSIGFSHVSFPCGVFNSTELWNFSGKLIVTSLETLNNALKIVNNIEIYYLYGLGKQENVLNLLNTLSSNTFKVIATDSTAYANFCRITNREPESHIENENILRSLT